MVSLKSLLVLYGSFMLLWSMILIYYLNRALVSQRQPTWLRTMISNGRSGEIVLYGSIVISPIILLFVTIDIIKRSISGVRK